MIESTDYCSVLAPATITDSQIISITSNGSPLAEDTNSAWDSNTTYSAGQRAYLNHRVYESAKDANQGRDPSQISNQYNAAGVITWWIEIGPTNRFAMFDSLINTQTSAPGPLTITLTPGTLNGFALFGIDGDTLSVTVKNTPGGDVIYSYSGRLDGSTVSDYYDYFFAPFKPQTQFIATGIDPYPTAEITITIGKGSGNVKLGMLAVGDVRPLGAPLRGASVEPQDYSVITTDAFGNTKIVKRPNAVNLNINAKMGIEDANTVLQTVRNLLGTPVVVIGSIIAEYEALTQFGLLSGKLQYDDFGEPVLNMSLRGLI